MCKATTPVANADYWQDKFLRNMRRDRLSKRRLVQQGWIVLVVWECETKQLTKLRERLTRELAKVTDVQSG